MNWFNDLMALLGGATANPGLANATPTSIGSWASGVGGDIASGLETGFVSLMKDFWAVIVGPLEILGGMLIIIFTLGLAFKDDLLSIAGPVIAGMAI
jgi:hypothetical protein